MISVDIELSAGKDLVSKLSNGGDAKKRGKVGSLLVDTKIRNIRMVIKVNSFANICKLAS